MWAARCNERFCSIEGVFIPGSRRFGRVSSITPCCAKGLAGSIWSIAKAYGPVKRRVLGLLRSVLCLPIMSQQHHFVPSQQRCNVSPCDEWDCSIVVKS